MPLKRKVLSQWFSAALSNSVFSYFVIQRILRWASASQDLPSFPVRHRRKAFWVKRSHLLGIHFSLCCQKFVWIMFGKKRKFQSGTVVYLCATTPYHHRRDRQCLVTIIVFSIYVIASGARFPKVFGPEKPFVNVWHVYSVKLVFFICCKQTRIQKNSPTEALF